MTQPDPADAPRPHPHPHPHRTRATPSPRERVGPQESSVDSLVRRVLARAGPVPAAPRAVLGALGAGVLAGHRAAVPRPRARHVPGPAGVRRGGPRGRRCTAVAVHPRLLGARGAARQHARAAGRGVDRVPLRAGGRRGVRHRRWWTAARVAGLRAGRDRLAARAAPRPALARPVAQARRRGSAGAAPPYGPRVLSLLGVVVFGLLFASADALFAEWSDVVVPDLEHRHVRAPRRSSRRSSAASCLGGVPRAQPAAGRPERRGDQAGRPALRVAGAGAARRRRLPRLHRCAGHRVLRRPRLPRADDRPDLRRVRAPGLRPAHRRHRRSRCSSCGPRPGRRRARRRPTCCGCGRPSVCCAR